MNATTNTQTKSTRSQLLRTAKNTFTATTQVKVVGVNGQISLGKQYAGRQVLLEESEAGVWLIRTATVIPDNERWLYKADNLANIAKAEQWAIDNPVRTDNADEVLQRLADSLAQ
jgi:hypothetical protein